MLKELIFKLHQNYDEVELFIRSNLIFILIPIVVLILFLFKRVKRFYRTGQDLLLHHYLQLTNYIEYMNNLRKRDALYAFDETLTSIEVISEELKKTVQKFKESDDSKERYDLLTKLYKLIRRSQKLFKKIND